jgi:hypothetical protein
MKQEQPDVNESTLCRFLQSSMLTTAKQRDTFLRCQYECVQGSPELFVFVDETGTDRRDSMRKYAFSL